MRQMKDLLEEELGPCFWQVGLVRSYYEPMLSKE
jgi:hypothetical protein